MFTSIRVRLTAWYAVAFALFELVFAVASYGFVARATGARVDEDLVRTASAVADALDTQQAFGAFPDAGVAAALRDFRLGDVAVAVLDRASGASVVTFELPASGQRPDWRRRFASPAPANFRAVLFAAPPAPALITLQTAGPPVRLYTMPYAFDGRALTVGVSQSLAPQQRTLADARTALAVGVPLMLAAAVVGGYALARRSLQPVATMTREAAHISAGTLHERLPVGDPRDELGRLAAVFNDLLGRLEEAFARQRRFVADASHELRTPVAIIAGETELALGREGRDAGALRAALATIGGETERLQQIVGDLFLLARADAGERPRAVEELYLADLVTSVTHAVRTLAARKGVTVAEHVDGDLPFRGDEGLLHRLLLNLVDNAIKFTPEGGHVTVTASERGGEYVIEVADSGPGIAPADQERVFERFFRAPATRPGNGAGSGAGLGLAIARWIAEAHGGRLELARSGAEGSTFAVTLPVPNEAPRELASA